MRRAAIAVAVAVVLLGVGSSAPAAAIRATDVPRPNSVQIERDLTYRKVDGGDLKLDAYLPPGGGLRPAVMVIYGGGWVEGNKELSGPFAQVLAQSGFAAFAMNYRLAPQHPYPAAVDDVQASVEWVRDHAKKFGIDPARIGAFGGSAGGHLAALLATLGHGPRDRGARVAAAVSWAGPMDLRPNEFPDASQLYLDAFLDCPGRPCDDAKAMQASPIFHVDASDAPILLGQGEEDELVPPDQAQRMAATLARAHVPHQLLLVPNAGHDERLAPAIAGQSLTFLRRELGGTEPSPPLGPTSGGGGGDSELAPTIAVVVAALVVVAVVIAVRRRRRRTRAALR